MHKKAFHPPRLVLEYGMNTCRPLSGGIMDKEKTKLRKLTLRSPAERQAAEQRRTSAMLSLIHI